jgi:hypothetical protein
LQEEIMGLRMPLAHRLSCSLADASEGTGIEPEELEREIEAGRIWTATFGERRVVIVSSLVQLLSDMARPAWPPVKTAADLHRNPDSA